MVARQSSSRIYKLMVHGKNAAARTTLVTYRTKNQGASAVNSGVGRTRKHEKNKTKVR